MTKPARPAPIDQYHEARPLLRLIRVMERFFDEVIDETPEYRKHLPELHCAYIDILNEELGPHAITLALAITQLEDRYAQIRRDAQDEQ